MKLAAINAPKIQFHVETKEHVELIPVIGRMCMAIRTRIATVTATEVLSVVSHCSIHEVHRPVEVKEFTDVQCDFVIV